jgi:hypothetical protein
LKQTLSCPQSAVNTHNLHKNPSLADWMLINNPDNKLDGPSNLAHIFGSFQNHDALQKMNRKRALKFVNCGEL